MAAHAPIEVAKTVLEVADLAFLAIETCHRHHHKESEPLRDEEKGSAVVDIESLHSENQRLRHLLQDNIALLQLMKTSSTFLENCPPDLHGRLLAAINSESFLNGPANAPENSKDDASGKFPFEVPSGADLEMIDVLIKVDHEEPSWWVWVSDEMIPGNAEEKSGIDNENYVIVSEEHVVDSIANFIAKCILAHPKARNFTPQQLRAAMIQSVGGLSKAEKMLNIWSAGKMFYTLASWGLALASLYQGRAILKLAVAGIHHSSKLALKTL